MKTPISPVKQRFPWNEDFHCAIGNNLHSLYESRDIPSIPGIIPGIPGHIPGIDLA